MIIVFKNHTNILFAYIINISIPRINIIAVIFPAIFFSFLNLNAQYSISKYTFESSQNGSLFTQEANKTVNSISNSQFLRNSESDISSIFGVSESYKGLRNGKAAYSTDWIISPSDPGVNAAKYYTFKVNTSNFYGIGLKFDLWTNEKEGLGEIGILYSAGGSKYIALGTYSLSQFPGIIYSFSLDFSHITDLNNSKEIEFRIYGFKAANSYSFLAIDNLVVTANSYSRGI